MNNYKKKVMKIISDTTLSADEQQVALFNLLITLDVESRLNKIYLNYYESQDCQDFFDKLLKSNRTFNIAAAATTIALQSAAVLLERSDIISLQTMIQAMTASTLPIAFQTGKTLAINQQIKKFKKFQDEKSNIIDTSEQIKALLRGTIYESALPHLVTTYNEPAQKGDE